jgi:uncharacterized protein
MMLIACLTMLMAVLQSAQERATLASIEGSPFDLI